ncbi:MAG TPA: ABC transporter permease [Candidatus Binatia bacterium]|nr:ABC transporter permease [Candidatus Binatia bacterium]
MTYSRLVLRNLLRHPLRAVLTTLSIALSIFLVCAVLTLPGALDAIFQRTSSNLRISVHHEAGLTYWLPFSFVQRVRGIPGVAGVSHSSWFGGIYDEPKNLFPNFAVDPENVEAVWPDYKIDPAALDRFRKTRNGALVGEQTMQKFGWEIGREITLRSTVFPVNLTFRIVGVIPAASGNPISLWFNRKYLEEAMEPFGRFTLVGMIWVRADAPEHVDTIMAAIDDLFRNSEAQVSAETEKTFVASFFSSMRSFMRVVLAVGFLVVGAVVLIAANTSAMAVRERIPEIAILKSLGFRRRPILAVLVAEATLQAVAGGVLGAAGAYAILGALRAAGKTGGATPFLGPLASFQMSPAVAAEGLAIALAVGLLAGFVPARNAARLNVVEALRRLF